MKKHIIFRNDILKTSLSILLFASFYIYPLQSAKPQNKPADNIPKKLEKLKAAYPQFISGIENNHIIWKDGTKLLYDDGKTKTDFETLLNTADLQDQMEQEYAMGDTYEIPAKNFEPGRIRNELFFRKMYGDSEKEVAKNLISVAWLPKSINKKMQVTTINGVDKKLMAVSDELEKLPHLKKYLDNPGGSFYWRAIAGTKRLSMHSFGIAVDINVNFSNYWKWDMKGADKPIPYKNQIPMEIVRIFEKHGFIWGGKWYHYDTMHFEYRPEIIR